MYRCPQGCYFDQNICVQALAGYFSTCSGSNCSTSLNLKLPCPPGTFSKSVGAVSDDTCLVCPKAAYCPLAAPQSYPCAAGTFNPSQGESLFVRPIQRRGCSSMFCMPTRQLQQQNGSVSVLVVSARQFVQFPRSSCPNALSCRPVSKPMGHDGVLDMPLGKLVRIKLGVAPILSIRAFSVAQRPIAVRPLCRRLILRHSGRLVVHSLQPRPVLCSLGLKCSLQLPRQPVPGPELCVELSALPRSGRASNSSNLVRFRQSDVID
jgi:hypothetical protein